tara:strand:+ start:1469 stop:1663 length:195 start_codon:yes stop_codon:yes gene_type:complete
MLTLNKTPVLFTEDEFFQRHAMDLNFEYGPEELISLAIERGFIKCGGNDMYFYAPLTKESFLGN